MSTASHALMPPPAAVSTRRAAAAAAALPDLSKEIEGSIAAVKEHRQTHAAATKAGASAIPDNPCINVPLSGLGHYAEYVCELEGCMLNRTHSSHGVGKPRCMTATQTELVNEAAKYPTRRVLWGDYAMRHMTTESKRYGEAFNLANAGGCELYSTTTVKEAIQYLSTRGVVGYAVDPADERVFSSLKIWCPQCYKSHFEWTPRRDHKWLDLQLKDVCRPGSMFQIFIHPEGLDPVEARDELARCWRR
jgi:hypothetical protein